MTFPYSDYAFALCEPCLGSLFERCVRKPGRREVFSVAPFELRRVPARPKVPKSRAER